MRALLVPVNGGSPVEIVRELTIVGRREECDLRLDHKSISKMHCVIVKTDGLLLIRDLGSTNGTRVNGQRIRRAALLPNDKLTIANVSFKVTFGGAEPDLPASPEDKTQALEAKEVARLLGKAPDEPADSAGDIPIQPIQANQLPDVYDDDKNR